jgi:hypothetical protein
MIPTNISRRILPAGGRHRPTEIGDADDHTRRSRRERPRRLGVGQGARHRMSQIGLGFRQRGGLAAWRASLNPEG